MMQGQEAIRSSLAGEEAARARRQSLLLAPHTLEFGEAKVLLTGAVSTEFNSNINLTETDPVRDVVFKPSLGLGVSWPVSSSTVLDSSLGIGYSKYATHPGLDRLRLQPGSGLNFDLFFKDVRVRLHDEISYTQDPVAQGAISGVAEYGMFSNESGVAIDWDINRLIINLSYNHSIFLSTRQVFNYLDRQSDSVSVRPALRLGTGSQVGIEAGVGWNDYRRTLLSDSMDRNAGVFSSMAIGEHSQLAVRGGVSSYAFEETGPALPARSSTSYYLNLRFDQQVNARLTHALEVGKTIQLGINSELISLWRVREQFTWRAFRASRIQAMLFFESGDESGRTVLDAPENFKRIGGELGWVFEISRHGDLRFDVQAVVKNSVVLLRDYTQFRTAIGYVYHF